MEISQKVKDKVAEVVELWAEETLENKPAILANAIYFSMINELQKKTDEIHARFMNVSCSKCGQEFGAGDQGFSDCDQHRGTQNDRTE